MVVTKHFATHGKKYRRRLIKYILNPDKTDNLKLVSDFGMSNYLDFPSYEEMVEMYNVNFTNNDKLYESRNDRQEKHQAGTWVKVAVTSGGMHFIPEGTLRSWGFSDPSKVKIYGYGGRRLPNLLGNSYLDDLPQTPSEMVAGNGLYFYAEGPKWWKSTSKGCNAPVSNPFTRQGYYFLSDSDPGERLTPQPIGDGAEPREDMMEFKDKVCHEVDMVSPGEAGFLLLGEDFKYTPSQKFPLILPDPVKGDRKSVV